MFRSLLAGVTKSVVLAVAALCVLVQVSQVGHAVDGIQGRLASASSSTSADR